jgi:hypothetical protein
MASSRLKSVRSSRDIPCIASVIVPFHRNLDYLERCLRGLASRPAAVEVIVASDGALEDCEALAHRYKARVVHLATNCGPAAARNRAAASAAGGILIFVDADVVVAKNGLRAMLARFAEDKDVAAVFGGYDDEPDGRGFFSQYKNLAHAFVHRAASGDVPTFWAGFGGVRADVFRRVGGFDETYTRPCIEDIELGTRLSANGYRVVVDGGLQACHLKQWTFMSMVRSDVRDRGIPWTRLILQSRCFPPTLNIDRGSRASVALSWTGVIGMAQAPLDWRWIAVATLALIATLWINRNLYGFLAAHRGVRFAMRGAGVHLIYHLYSGVAFLIGAAAHFMINRGGVPSGAVVERALVSAVAPRAKVNSCQASPGTT